MLKDNVNELSGQRLGNCGEGAELSPINSASLPPHSCQKSVTDTATEPTVFLVPTLELPSGEKNTSEEVALLPP